MHHILFGRLTYRDYRGKKYIYYVQGMLDKTPFIRLVNSKIFVLNLDDVNVEELRIFADIEVEEYEKVISFDELKTGEEYWRNVAKEKELDFHVRRNTKKHKRT